jgi:5'-phosphate synthase pdxT subunit
MVHIDAPRSRDTAARRTPRDTTQPGDHNRPRIGVLAVQGDVSEHVASLERIGATARLVKRPDDLEVVEGLILPGGESTALRRLLDYEGLLERVREKFADGMPVFGTCAGAILLATEVKGAPAPHLSLLPMTVRRNAFGRQRESFVTELDVAGLSGGPLTAVFIRAPVIEAVGPGIEILATVDDEIVLAETEQALVASFHPELTRDDRLHQRFLEKVRRRTCPPPP